ncbi:tetratricopeptide repeat protein [Fundidesulfovibrio terrae]|uniref:tetratricopeptide repeat protein n=1 Tax=Fundidesulfovibrio terrae TaxID=2922866 RepID=UPI001FAFE12E|nr:tetratricopeptide repeat protein [Fundidesulfovibrio terrae]
MQDNSPESLVAQARKNLLNIVSVLKDGNVDSAIKVVVFGLGAYIKYGNILIKQEKKEFQELLTKAVHLLSLDPLVKEASKTPLDYVPRKETELLARLRALPDLIQANQARREGQEAEARMQAKGERMEKGRQLLMQKYFDGALQLFKRLCDDFPDDAELRAEIGKVLFDINHIECITFLEQAVALDPKDHKSLAMMGVAFRKIKKFDQAERAYLNALAVDKDNVNYLFNLSRVYIDSGNWLKAQETLRRVLTIDPSLEPAKKGLDFATRHCRDLI